MKKYILVILLVILSAPVDAQIKNQLNQQKLNRNFVIAKKVKNVGLSMTIAGGVAVVGGSVMAKNGLSRNYPSTPGHITSDTYSTVGGVIGLGLVMIGVPVLCIGIPTLTVGIVTYHRAQKNLQLSLIDIDLPYNTRSINGIGLTIQF